MAQIGLADTLKLLAAGYKKKDIEALASIDETPIQGQDPVPTPTAQPSEDPAPVPEDKEEEPDYKKLYDDLVKKNHEAEDKIKKLQQDNVHGNSAPAAAEAKEKQQASLNDLVRSFM